MKLNMGCGNVKLPGFVNVDHFAGCAPDMLVDLEQTPWPWKDSSVEYVTFDNSLEHIGQQSRVFLDIMVELYRICQDGAIIEIVVPHPRHDNFLNDPTHVRPITIPLLTLFSKAANEESAAQGAANTPLALQLGVDFKIIDYKYILGERYRLAFESGQITHQELDEALDRDNNVAAEIRVQLQVLKANSGPVAAATLPRRNRSWLRRLLNR